MVAAAVVLKPHIWDVPEISAVNDSKKLSDRMRRNLVTALTTASHLPDPPLRWRVAEASVQEIDSVNIRAANFLAMGRALDGLGVHLKTVLVDGTGGLTWKTACMVPLVKGDQRSLSIAIASLFAKVTRDDIMERLHAAYPMYGWDTNKGYGTASHHHALTCHGPTPHHRLSYKPVAALSPRASL